MRARAEKLIFYFDEFRKKYFESSTNKIEQPKTEKKDEQTHTYEHSIRNEELFKLVHAITRKIEEKKRKSIKQRMAENVIQEVIEDKMKL